MLIKTTRPEIQQALERANEKYNGNLTFNNFAAMQNRSIGCNRFRVTLKVKDSHGKGARLGFPSYETGKQRHLISACWHVHGDFMDALFEIQPMAEVISRNNKITADYGNWEDFDIGSMVRPLWMSEACEC